MLKFIIAVLCLSCHRLPTFQPEYRYTVIITICDVMNDKPASDFPRAAEKISRYIFELSVVGISVNVPTMLADISQICIYINTYDSKTSTMNALVDTPLTGKEVLRKFTPSTVSAGSGTQKFKS